MSNKKNKRNQNQLVLEEEVQLLEKTRQLEEKVETLENTAQQMQEKFTKLEKQYETLRQLINDTDTKTLIKTTQQDKDIQTLQTNVTTILNTKNDGNTVNTISKTTVDITAPTFSGDNKEEHPKQFLKEIHNYLEHKQITTNREKMLVIENNLRGKAAKWYAMIKDAALDETTFNELFLKHFFSESHQWDIFIKCTEAGKKPIKKDFQEHFHHWMAELKHLDSPKMNEEQAINLITKHFPISIQAYIQTTNERTFLPIWEKLGELENNVKQEEEPIRHNENPPKQTYPRQNNTYNRMPYTISSQNHRNTSELHKPYTQKPAQHQGGNHKPNIRQLTTGQLELNDDTITSDREELSENDEETKNWEQGTVELDQHQS
uniref:Ty3 transposon capsid-like protein domain-containing protein n=1 Tax=Schizaphis graminum TaxID=13262 RepID=A0A2S2P9K8_SCHGA